MATVYIASYELMDEHDIKIIGVFDTLEGAYDAIEIAKKFEGEEIFDSWVNTYTVNEMVHYEKLD